MISINTHLSIWKHYIQLTLKHILLKHIIYTIRVNPIYLSYPFLLPLPLSFARSRESKGYPNSRFDRGVGLRGSGRYLLKPSIFASLLETRAGLVIGHTWHFPGGPTHWRGRQNFFYFLLFFLPRTITQGQRAVSGPLVCLLHWQRKPPNHNAL